MGKVPLYLGLKVSSALLSLLGPLLQLAGSIALLTVSIKGHVRKVDLRQLGNGNSNSHGARPVYSAFRKLPETAWGFMSKPLMGCREGGVGRRVQWV